MFFLFCACASAKIDIIQTGPWFPEKKKKSLEIFSDRNKIKKPFGAIAIIHSERYLCSDKNHKKHIDKAAEVAAKTGADALVYAVGEYAAELNPGIPPECYLSAMAVKYVDKEKGSENEKNKNSF